MITARSDSADPLNSVANWLCRRAENHQPTYLLVPLRLRARSPFPGGTSFLVARALITLAEGRAAGCSLLSGTGMEACLRGGGSVGKGSLGSRRGGPEADSIIEVYISAPLTLRATSKPMARVNRLKPGRRCLALMYYSEAMEIRN